MAKKTTTPTQVASIRHKDKRANIPTEELRDFVADDELTPTTMRYPRDPSLDPQLVWKGKDDLRLHEEVKTVPAGASHLTFEAPSTASWTPGNFEVEIFLGDEEGGSESFEIKAATPS